MATMQPLPRPSIRRATEVRSDAGDEVGVQYLRELLAVRAVPLRVAQRALGEQGEVDGA
jgi:hypothetical protein